MNRSIALPDQASATRVRVPPPWQGALGPEQTTISDFRRRSRGSAAFRV